MLNSTFRRPNASFVAEKSAFTAAGVGDVGGQGESAIAGIAGGGAGGLERVGATAGEHDMEAGLQQGQRRGAADAAAGAGDESDFFS